MPIEDRLAALQPTVQAHAGSANAADSVYQTLRGAITRLEDERDKLSLDWESMAVRRKAIEQAIARISKTAEEQIKSDRIALELEKLVQSREAELKRMQDLLGYGLAMEGLALMEQTESPK